MFMVRFGVICDDFVKGQEENNESNIEATYVGILCTCGFPWLWYYVVTPDCMELCLSPVDRFLNTFLQQNNSNFGMRISYD